jgi:hypothetical protein
VEKKGESQKVEGRYCQGVGLRARGEGDNVGLGGEEEERERGLV